MTADTSAQAAHGGPGFVAVGDEAPDFTLKDQDNQPVTLSSFRGRKNVLIVFFPLAFTGVCQGELCRVRDNLPTFQNDDSEIIAVSVGPSPSHKIWAAEQGYTFPLLSDFWPHGEVSKLYGVFNESAGIANRGTFVVDKGGVVRFAEMNGPGEPRDQSLWERALASLAE